MNLFIRYNYMLTAENFKIDSLKKLRKNKPMDSQPMTDISLSRNKECIGVISKYIDYETVSECVKNGEIPECFQTLDMLTVFVSYSLYLWIDSHIMDYYIDADLLHISNVDELNYFLKCYKKKLVKIYKKYGKECVRHLLKFDKYLNQVENDKTREEFTKAKEMLYNETSTEEYREIINGMMKDQILTKISLEYFKNSIVKGYEYYEKNIRNGKTPNALLSLYLKFSFLKGDSSRVINNLKESNYESVIEYHMEALISRMQDLAMVSNTFLEHNGVEFTGISKVSNDDKTRIINRLVLKRRNTDKIVRHLKDATLDNSGHVRYSPSKVLNYMKIKKGIDSITEEN